MKKTKLFISVILCAVFVFSFAISAFAATSVALTTTASAKSVYVNKTFTLTVTFKASGSNIGYYLYKINFDKSQLKCTSSPTEALVGSNGDIQTQGQISPSNTKGFATITHKYTFQAIKISTANISVVPSQFVDMNEKNVSGISQKQVSVKITAAPEASTENRLSELNIFPGELSPDFSPDVISYTASVPFATKELLVTAAAKDSKAKVKLSETALRVGQNDIKVYVTAENGKQKTYSLKVTREASDYSEQSVNIGDKEYKFVCDPDIIETPKGFKADSAVFNDSKVLSYSSFDGSVSLVVLSYEENNEWFSFNKETGKIENAYFSAPSDNVFLFLDFPDSAAVSENLVKTDLKIEDTSVIAYKLSSPDRNLYYVYGVDMSGKSGVYFYDSDAKTYILSFDGVSGGVNVPGGTDNESYDVLNAKLKDAEKRANIAEIIAIVIAIIFVLSLVGAKVAFSRFERREEK